MDGAAGLGISGRSKVTNREEEMDRQESVTRAEEKMDRLNAATDHEILDRAWDELSALCGSRQPHKNWLMTIPVDADRDSAIIFGEVLRRFGKSVGYEHPKTEKPVEP